MSLLRGFGLKCRAGAARRQAYFTARRNDVLLGRAPAATEQGVRVHVHPVDRPGVAEDRQAASF